MVEDKLTPKIKEQILQESIKPNNEWPETCIIAMETYKNQEVDIATKHFGDIIDQLKKDIIGFKEWQDENLEDKKWENYDGHDTWYNPITREVISTSELYDLYLLQHKQK